MLATLDSRAILRQLGHLGKHFNITNFPCDLNTTRPKRPELSRNSIIGRPGGFLNNRTEIKCEEPITCGRAFNMMGIVDCYQTRFGNKHSACLDPAYASEDNECGFCEDEDNIEKCPFEFNLPFSEEKGVMIANTRFGFDRCATKADAVTRQLNGRYTCVEECPTLP